MGKLYWALHGEIRTDLDFVRNKTLALEAVILSFHAGKQEHSESMYPDVVIIEFQYSKAAVLQ